MRSLTYLLLTLLILAGGQHIYGMEEKPNVLVILTDDAGYADFGFMGSKDIKTPHLDKLADSGVVFTDAHVAATVCAPSRACLMTGRYGHRFGFECNPSHPDQGLPSEEKTMAELFKQHGYTTAAIGKWHLGGADSQHPNQRGFDYFFGMLAGGREYFYNPQESDKPGSQQNILENKRQVAFDGYLTDVFSEKASLFIRKADKPFFMYLAYNAVHSPMQAMPEDMARFQGHPRQKLAAMTYALDRGVGQVIQELKNTGKWDNTLIFFLNDNGGATYNQSSNYPFKGFKGNKFEGGQRVPFVVTWGNRLIRPKRFEGLTSSLDILATALDAAGIDSSKLVHKLDGVSLLPYLSGKKSGNPHEILFWRKQDTRAARSGNYKLITMSHGETALYNISTDLSEKNDLSREQPKKVQEILKAITTWEEGCISPKWIEEGSWGKITNEIHRKLLSDEITTSEDWNQFCREKKKQQSSAQ